MMLKLVLALAVFASYTTGSSATCTESQLRTFVEENTDEECRKVYETASSFNTIPVNELCEICTEDCMGAISEWYASPVCNNDTRARGFVYNCQQSDGGTVGYCHLIDGSVFTNTDLFDCASFASNRADCSGNCSAGLRYLSQEIGCCYQLIYNSTTDLDLIQGAGHIDATARSFLEILRMPDLWSTCDVPTPQECTSPTFRKDSGFIINPSILIVVVSVFASLVY